MTYTCKACIIMCWAERSALAHLAGKVGGVGLVHLGQRGV